MKKDMKKDMSIINENMPQHLIDSQVALNKRIVALNKRIKEEQHKINRYNKIVSILECVKDLETTKKTHKLIKLISEEDLNWDYIIPFKGTQKYKIREMINKFNIGFNFIKHDDYDSLQCDDEIIEILEKKAKEIRKAFDEMEQKAFSVLKKPFEDCKVSNDYFKVVYPGYEMEGAEKKEDYKTYLKKKQAFEKWNNFVEKKFEETKSRMKETIEEEVEDTKNWLVAGENTDWKDF